MRKLLAHVRSARRRLVVDDGYEVSLARDIFFARLTAHLLTIHGILPESAELSARSCSEAMRHLLHDPPQYLCRAALHEKAPVALDEFIMEALKRDPLSMGWAYQFWNDAERDTATMAISRRGEDLTRHDEVAVATQLFTEGYMATFLIERFLALERSESAVPGRPAGNILDPACGVGHLLVPFLRALVAQSRQRGVEPHYLEDALSRLHGCDIDPTAVEICRVILFAEAHQKQTRNGRALWAILGARIQHLPSPWGTLDRGEAVPLLRQAYSCVVANPPYIGRRKLCNETRAFLDTHYPATSMDLCSAFMERCIELTAAGGMLGLVTVDKWLRLKGYEVLRTGGKGFAGLYRAVSLDMVCELGQRAFSSASGLHDGVGVCLLSARKSSPDPSHTFIFFSTADEPDMDEKVRALENVGQEERCWIRQADLLRDGQSSSFMFHHRVPSSLTRSHQTVRNIADVVVGLQTSDDRRFVHHVWSVPPDSSRWMVHSKGGGYARWFGLNTFVLDWRDGESRFEADPKSGIGVSKWFHEEGWTYTWFANGSLGLRKKERGWSFGRAASSGFFSDDTRCVAFLNSRVASLLVRRRGGKAQLPEGIVRSLPIPESFDGIDPRLVDAAVSLRQELVAHDPTEASFSPRRVWEPCEQLSIQALLHVVEGILERQVCDVLKLSPAEGRELDEIMGVPVGWNERRSSTHDDKLWRFIPQRLEWVRPLVEPFERCDRVRSAGRPDCATYFESRVKIPQVGKPLPVTSLVESISRSTGLHPFDVAADVMRLMESRRAIRDRIIGPPLFARIVTLALTELGHQWWGEPVNDCVRRYEEIEARELADRIEPILAMVFRVSPDVQNDLIGESLVKWIALQVRETQLRIFSQTPLVRWQKGRSIESSSFRHIWGAEDPLIGCDIPASLEQRSL